MAGQLFIFVQSNDWVGTVPVRGIQQPLLYMGQDRGVFINPSNFGDLSHADIAV